MTRPVIGIPLFTEFLVVVRAAPIFRQIFLQDENGLGEMMSSMMVGVMEESLELLARPSTATQYAKFQKNYYDALQEEGFSKDEAFRLLRAGGNPLSGMLSGN